MYLFYSFLYLFLLFCFILSYLFYFIYFIIYVYKVSRHIKDLIVDKDEEIELLQEQLNELKLEKDELQALLDISESVAVATFENGRYAMELERFVTHFWL